MNMKTVVIGAAAAAAMAGGASAGEWLDLEGSLGEGGFSRYVPPVSNPIFNETPLITTEIRPIYFHQKINKGFADTGGGSIDVVAAQVRVAITDRLGFLATTDGIAWVDFDNEQTLRDESGLADLAVGLKYAAIYDPAAGEILTIGARYTLPSGNLDTNGVELTGYGDGYLHVFGSGMKIVDGWQFQGNVGIQQALSSHNSSFFYASGHVSYEIMPGVYPLVEANAYVYTDGGDQLSGGLGRLTGFDVADLGSTDPQDIFTVAAGARFRPAENVILGAVFEYNLAEDQDHLFEWRAMFDAVIHF